MSKILSEKKSPQCHRDLAAPKRNLNLGQNCNRTKENDDLLKNEYDVCDFAKKTWGFPNKWKNFNNWKFPLEPIGVSKVIEKIGLLSTTYNQA